MSPEDVPEAEQESHFNTYCIWCGLWLYGQWTVTGIANISGTYNSIYANELKLSSSAVAFPTFAY